MAAFEALVALLQRSRTIDEAKAVSQQILNYASSTNEQIQSSDSVKALMRLGLDTDGPVFDAEVADQVAEAMLHLVRKWPEQYVAIPSLVMLIHHGCENACEDSIFALHDYCLKDPENIVFAIREGAIPALQNVAFDELRPYANQLLELLLV
jgi:hypothetical protein